MDTSHVNEIEWSWRGEREEVRGKHRQRRLRAHYYCVRCGFDETRGHWVRTGRVDIWGEEKRVFICADCWTHPFEPWNPCTQPSCPHYEQYSWI